MMNSNRYSNQRAQYLVCICLAVALAVYAFISMLPYFGIPIDRAITTAGPLMLTPLAVTSCAFGILGLNIKS